MKDIIERLQMVADIKDASSIPPEFLDNTVFLQIMKDAIREIQDLRFNLNSYRSYQQMTAYTPAIGIGTQTTTATTNPNQYPYSLSGWTQISPTVSHTMIYTEAQVKSLADKAIEEAKAEAIE